MLSRFWIVLRSRLSPFAPAGRRDGGEGSSLATHCSPPHPHSLSPEAGAREVISWWLCCAVVLILLAGVCRPVTAQQPAKPRELLVDQVRKALDRGVQYLRDQEKGRGNWEDVDQASVIMRGGWTSLAMLALLNAGVKPDDPIIDRGLKYLRTIEPSKTYVVALQTMVFAEAGHSQDRVRIQRNLDWLVSSMVRDKDGKCIGWSYDEKSRFPDNSNTQYALLGLHAGKTANVKIDRSVWESIQSYYVSTQQDGGWIYNLYDPAFQREVSLTMTTAGVCGLLISGMELNAGREILNADGTATNCGVYKENQPLARGLRWVGDRFRLNLPYNAFYNIYGIERVGRLSGQRFLGRHDWYREGCEFLVKTQRDDGSWHEQNHRDAWPVISSSFAILFLSKGRTPVLISKLAHGPGDDWNNDRNDARNVVEYTTKEVFRRLPLAWQVFDASHADVSSDEDIQNLSQELLQSPIVYFNGHEAPRFTDVEERLIKTYVDQGGFLLAEACCGRKEFDQGFRDLMKRLFPDNPLKKLSPEHPLWRAHAVIPPSAFNLEGIEYGCKTVVIYSPEDLSCLWEANQSESGRGQQAFRLAGNIVAYATGMEPPKPRLTPAEMVVEDGDRGRIRRGFLKVAQLRHEGDWQPAPNAMRNLMDNLRKGAKLDVDLETRAINASDTHLADYRFLYMHGRGNFALSPQGLKNLRTDLETGGLLFADACCGKKAFDTSFRELAAKLFPDKKLEVIPAGDDLYSQDLNGEAITRIRCRTDSASDAGPAEFKSMSPQLEGIKIQSRWVIIYSKYDIGCALEKHQTTDCLGHDHKSAITLGSAAVLYALKR